MKQNINYQRELDQLIQGLEKSGSVPKLLIHSCCAPCSSYVLEYLSSYFHITVLYYNPNIYPPEEYAARAEEQRKLVEELPAINPIKFVESRYVPEEFYGIARGLEKEREGEERCFRCYRLRLEEAAIYAKEHGFDYFTTTLSISPLKKAGVLNQIGEELGTVYGVKYLLSDFKKKEGYKRSIQLSKDYGLYRQDYCGCVYSKVEADQRERLKQEQNV